MKSQVDNAIRYIVWENPARLFTNGGNRIPFHDAWIARNNGGVVPGRIVESYLHPFVGYVSGDLPCWVSQDVVVIVWSQQPSQTWWVPVLNPDSDETDIWRNKNGVWDVPDKLIRKIRWRYLNTIEIQLEEVVIGSQRQDYLQKKNKTMSHVIV